MNPLPPKLITGTAGELITQLRLFQFGVQAAPPLKDSGNDLIAVRGEAFKAIQIKTTRSTNADRPTFPTNRAYHLLAWVKLAGENNIYAVDQSTVYLLPISLAGTDYDVEEYLLTEGLVETLFRQQ